MPEHSYGNSPPVTAFESVDLTWTKCPVFPWCWKRSEKRRFGRMAIRRSNTSRSIRLTHRVADASHGSKKSQEETAMATHNILLIADDTSDNRLVSDLVKQNEKKYKIHVAVDGLDAIDFLLQRGKHVTAPRPDLILLDLNLPKKDGRQVLKEIKKHPRFRQIPVLIQTTSNAEQDIFASYDCHANGYLVKAMSLDELSVQLKRIEEFWFQESILPKEKLPAPSRRPPDEEMGKQRDDELTDTHKKYA
jgi:two-component system, chemotaxis family, response regulator Rcp1